MCPGRFFANHEIQMTLATMITWLDIEIVEWVHLDGSRSACLAGNDLSVTGALANPPDRDMKVRLKWS